VYQNEEEVGAGIKAKIAEGVVKRENLYVVSKLWNTKHRADLVVPSCKKTLSDLGLDYVDLYLIHWPMGYLEDTDQLCPADADGKFIPSKSDFLDTWKEMEKCVQLGLTKSIGLSNFNSEQVSKVLENCTIKPVVNQIEVHPYLNQAKLVDWLKTKDIYVMGYSPLASPKKPWSKPTDPNPLDEVKLQEIAKKYKKTAAQVVLRWVVQRGIIVIPKSVQKKRLQENVDIFDFTLAPEDVAKISAIEAECGRYRGGAELSATTHKDYPFHIEF